MPIDTRMKTTTPSTLGVMTPSTGSSSLLSMFNKKPTTAPTGGNASATGLTSPSPAKAQYISSLAGSGGTQAGMSVAEYQAAVAGKNGGAGTTGSDPATPATPDPMASYRSAFETYLASLAPSSELQSARTSLADLQSDIFSKSLSGRRAYEERLDRSGGTVRGAQEAAGLISRNANRELADMSVQENALANTLNALSGAEGDVGDLAKSRMDFEKFLIENEPGSPEGFELSEGQSRYEYNPKTGAYEQIANIPKTYAPKSGSSSLRIIGSSDDGYYQVNEDGTISPMQVRPEVSWEDYVAAAQEELGMSLDPKSEAYKQLRAQYDSSVGSTAMSGGNDWGI